MSSPDRTPATWHLTPEQRRVALQRRLSELQAWSLRAVHDLGDWTFTFPGRAPQAMTLGEAWPALDIAVADGPVQLDTTFTVPPDFRDASLELDVGGEALVTLSTGVRGGLNPYHRRFPLRADPGETVVVRAQAVPKGLFGTPSEDARLKVARLVVPEPAVDDLCLDLEVLLDSVRLNAAHPAAPHLLTAAEDALAGLRWPSDLGAYLGRLGAGVVGDMGSIWNPPTPRPLTPLPDDVLASVEEAREALRARLDALRTHLPPVGALAVSGHAHLDLAWLWPVAESRRKALRTLSSVLHLMDEFPDWTFNQSSAQLYAWLEQDAPDVFARVQERVREGRLEPVGGMWVEPDCAMTGGESLARQLLYGQAYFQSRFGRRCEVAWLPDTFGFTGALPQLLRQAGITGFFTTKLTWNETTTFPHDLWWWEGHDGSRVLAHAFKNDSYGALALGSYNGDISPEHLLRVLHNDRGTALAGWRGRAPETLFTFGLGDGAGGPTAEMLRRAQRLSAFPGLPRVRHARVDEVFRALPREGLPVWVGELYFELHRGTLSSQGAIKHLNRQAEHRLLEADAALALAHWAGRDVQSLHARAEAAWKTTLFHQFHDVLPGSSVREVYAEGVPAMQDAVQDAQALVHEALGAEGDARRVWNASLHPRPLEVLLPGESGEWCLEGREDALPAQTVPGGLLLVAPDVTVPPLGSVTLRPHTGQHGTDPGGPQVTVVPDGTGGYWLRSAHVNVWIDGHGQLRRLVTAAGRDALGGAGHRLVAFGDLPRNWEAWDINPDTQDATLGKPLGRGAITEVQAGPLQASVTVTYAWRSSRITQTVTVTAGRARVDVHTAAHWQERRTLLKAFVDVRARSDHATFETAFGAVRRPTHRNALADAAKFEGSGHRFADLSEPGFGLALLNDGKYGHGAYGSELSLTLLRGPLYPDPLADVGEHAFTYSLLPHGGDWTQGGVLAEATALNSPLLALSGSGDLTPPARLSGQPVALGSLKPAEDGRGVILRVYEPYGARGDLHLHAQAGTTLELTNLLEDAQENATLATAAAQGGEEPCWTVPVRPFEVLSFRLLPTPTPAR